jgi:two-component system nitrate/nitrite response regulator NarL
MNDKVSIAVVDDHPIFRLGVIRVLKNEPSFEVVAEGTCATDAVDIALSFRPDVMLLDMSMPGGGLSAAREITARSPETKIVFLTMVDDETIVSSAFKAGARGYVLKGVSAPELIRTIWSTRQGDAYVTPDLAARMLAALAGGDAEAPAGPRLSAVDQRILSLVMEGRALDRIASELRLETGAVKLRLANAVALLRASLGDSQSLVEIPGSADALH